MGDDTICGACQGPWPCDCANAAPVTLMDTSSELARRMRSGAEDPLAVQPFDPDPPIKTDRNFGEGFCGHYGFKYNLDPDKRVVTCRKCEAQLDPYEVLEHLAAMLMRQGERLAALQELERREATRERERKARAAVRRHRYAQYMYKRGAPHCATCGGQEADAIHTSERVEDAAGRVSDKEVLL